MAKFCANCGNSLKEDENFCSSCGTPVLESVSSVENTSTPISTPDEKKNVIALVGFISSIVSSTICCGSLNIITLILSIIGLVEAKKYNNDGKSFAIAGIVISAIMLILFVLLSFIISLGIIDEIYTSL